jgi:hypothetical protein
MSNWRPYGRLKYRLGRLIIGGRRVNSILDRPPCTGGRAADGGPTLPELYRGDCCSFMSLACGHAHLNSGSITPARNINVRSAAQRRCECTPGDRDFQAPGHMNETHKKHAWQAASHRLELPLCHLHLPGHAMGLVSQVLERVIGPGCGPQSFMTLATR